MYHFISVYTNKNRRRNVTYVKWSINIDDWVCGLEGPLQTWIAFSWECKSLCLFPLKWGAHMSSCHPFVKCLHSKRIWFVYLFTYLQQPLTSCEVGICTSYLWVHISYQPANAPGVSDALMCHWMKSLFWYHLESVQYILVSWQNKSSLNTLNSILTTLYFLARVTYCCTYKLQMSWKFTRFGRICLTWKSQFQHLEMEHCFNCLFLILTRGVHFLSVFLKTSFLLTCPVYGIHNIFASYCHIERGHYLRVFCF